MQGCSSAVSGREGVQGHLWEVLGLQSEQLNSLWPEIPDHEPSNSSSALPPAGQSFYSCLAPSCADEWNESGGEMFCFFDRRLAAHSQ